MPQLRNHTPHPIVVETAGGGGFTLAPVAPTPRVVVTRSQAGSYETPHGSVPLSVTDPIGEVRDLPPAQDDVLLVVARVVAAAAPQRRDLVFPDELVRDPQGRVVACRGLGAMR